MAKIDYQDEKFIELLDATDYEVLSDTGWVPITVVGKTIPYRVHEVKTRGGRAMRGADEHLFINSRYEEVYLRDLQEGDLLIAEDSDSPLDPVASVRDLGYEDNMYDLQVDHPNHRYYTNGILSHNSTVLCNIAAEAVRNGVNVIFYTFEMSDKRVMQRVGANLLNMPMKDYWVLSQDKVALKNRMNMLELQNLRIPGRLIIKEFPTGSASANDLIAHCAKTEETLGIEFPLVVIDYINIMQNSRNPNSENTYLKIKQLSEDIRGWAVKRNKCTVTATQSNKSTVESSDFSSAAVAESSGLSHTVDGMFAIIQDLIMHANNEYYFKVLLNRNDGWKNSKKKFTVNYNFMKITEDLTSEIVTSAN